MMGLNKRIGMALTGSFCTFSHAMECMRKLVEQGCEIRPIFSYNAATQDTRFGTAEHWLTQAEQITGEKPWCTLQEVEPIGPKGLLDALLVLPCTGNTLGKLAANIIDTPVTMAVKSMMRRERPVVLAVSTNDGLGASCKNIGTLLERRGIYFVPFLQDDPAAKPRSLAPRYDLVEETLKEALEGRQLQPILSAAQPVQM